jgi:hypothetical protein
MRGVFPLTLNRHIIYSGKWRYLTVRRKKNTGDERTTLISNDMYDGARIVLMMIYLMMIYLMKESRELSINDRVF